MLPDALAVISEPNIGIRDAPKKSKNGYSIYKKQKMPTVLLAVGILR
jgi:hypothetical protein